MELRFTNFYNFAPPVFFRQSATGIKKMCIKVKFSAGYRGLPLLLVVPYSLEHVV